MPPSTGTSLKTLLNQRGCRMTQQRQTILHIFQTLPQGDHLSAEDLHQILRQKGTQISLSTVYRTLHLMAYMGLLRELELAEGHKHYELKMTYPHQHHHLVCVQCNATLEFKNDAIDLVGTRHAEIEGYYLLDCQLTIYAVCSEALECTRNGSMSKNWLCSRAKISESVTSESVTSEPVTSEPVTSEPVTSEPVRRESVEHTV
jgi:Fur family transcriptional regulator, ferric uptake regulator